jgi:hypothetical protein
MFSSRASPNQQIPQEVERQNLQMISMSSKSSAREPPIPDVHAELETCRARVHKWGKKYKVTFDASKEHLVILHPSLNHGESFKLLGYMIDTDLRMKSAIDQLLAKIRPKITAILRTRAYYSLSQFVTQFKTHIWGLMEAHSGGIFHACSTLLVKIDYAQNRFLHELNLSHDRAFLEFNFTPPSFRRNIGILGLMHKRVLSKCDPTYQRLLPFYTERFPEGRGFGHSK